MKYLVKFFVVTFFMLICTYSLAEQKVVYIDLKFVLNNEESNFALSNIVIGSIYRPDLAN